MAIWDIFKKKRRFRRIVINRRFGKQYLSKAKIFKFGAVFGFFFLIFMLLFSAVLFAWSARSLPSPDKVVRREGFTTKILDRNEKLLYEVFKDERRTPVNLSEIPDNLKNATIAIEDKNFYKHQGFDPFGLVRAVYYSVVFERSLAGGSTLTQQLVKNVLLGPQRTITRKVKEFILATQIENKYTKDEILQMYLNEAPYGGTAVGVSEAAETYFGKNVSELNLAESAIIAGLPQRPTFYSPFNDSPDAYKNRTKDVLRRMREDEYISKRQEEEAIAELDKIKFNESGGDFKAPHFVMYVKQLLVEKYGENVVEQGGLKVTTTLDLDIQEKAQEIVKEEIDKVESLHITNGAAVVLDPQTGEILAMVGSKDYNDPDYDGKVNVTLSLRQPGSSIKPVTYATALEKGYTPATVIADVKTEFPGGTGKAYVPVNYDGKDHGSVDLRRALGSSLNIASVKLLAMVGIQSMMETAYQLGIDSLEPTKENMARFGLSVTLGGGEVRLLELTSAYSAFANTGYKVEPSAILSVEDRDGKVLEKITPKKGRRILSEQVAYLISNILSDNNARLLTFGVNSLLNIPGQTVAVKTGTTDDKRDNWTVGWTPKFIVGVWVGNNDNSEMTQVASGVSGASPIWRRIVLEMLSKKSTSEFAMPANIERIDVDAVSGWPAHDGYSSKSDLFIKGTIPTGDDSIHHKIKVCKGQNDRLATPTLIARNDYDEREVIELKENDPVSTDGRNRWQEGIDAWAAAQGDERYHIPKDYCDGSQGSEVVVSFQSPSDKQRIDSNEIEVKLEAVANKGIDKIEIFIDDKSQEFLYSKPYRKIFVLSNGPHSIKAKAYDTDGKTAEQTIKIGINTEWDYSSQPSPTPKFSVSPSPSPTPTLSPIPPPGS